MMRLAVMIVDDSKREELFLRRDGGMASCCLTSATLAGWL